MFKEEQKTAANLFLFLDKVLLIDKFFSPTSSSSLTRYATYIYTAMRKIWNTSVTMILANYTHAA